MTQSVTGTILDPWQLRALYPLA